MGLVAEGRLAFARWRSSVASGGNRYDDEIAGALADHGRLQLRERFVEGTWPVPGEQDRTALAELLQTEQHWLIDNIIASAAPEAIRDAVAAGRRVAVLVHYFPADDLALSPDRRALLVETEAAALAAATTVITTSAWTADEVRRRYGRDDAVVAVPGVDPAPLAHGSLGAGDPPHLLWLARLTETKDPETFVRALADLGDLEWTARIVGPDTLEAPLTERLTQRIADAGLAERVELTGPRHGADLDALWERTDLLVHTARTEPYGMVVTEALARGIPSIVCAGTGAVEPQGGAGGQFSRGDAEALAELLRRWLSDDGMRRAWSKAARYRRDRLPTWDEAARIIADAC